MQKIIFEENGVSKSLHYKDEFGTFSLITFDRKKIVNAQGNVMLANFEVFQKRKGHGSKMFVTVEELCIETKIKKFLVISEQTIEAIKFWDKISFGIINVFNYSWWCNVY